MVRQGRWQRRVGGRDLAELAAERDVLIRRQVLVPEEHDLPLQEHCPDLGDDYGAIGFAHGTYGGELELYARESGFSPLDLIRWGTRNGAAVMRRSHELGAVEPGKLADLLVLDGDPSADITVLSGRAPAAVLKGGAVVAGALR